MGQSVAEFNTHAYRGTEILVARRNFGGGSSREAAVYALVDHGFRAVVAPSFGDIFSSSAVKNGLLPARVSEAKAEALLAGIAAEEIGALTLDLGAKPYPQARASSVSTSTRSGGASC